MKVKPLFPAASALALLCAASPPARAIGPGEVVLGNEIVFRLRVPAGGLTLQQRGDLLQERLNEVLAITDLNENDVTVLPTRYGPTIYVRGKKLLTVDAETAKASQMKPAPLARAWARRLAAVLPEVNVRLPGGPPPARSPLDPPLTRPSAPPATPPSTPPSEPPMTPPSAPPSMPPGTPSAEPPAEPPGAPPAASPMETP